MALERVARHSHYNLNYHVVLTPKYRQAVLTDQVRERLIEVTNAVCTERDWLILGFEVMPDHVHLFISCPPKWAPSDIVKIVKGVTARRILQEFRHLARRGHFWTNTFYIGTAGTVSAETIRRYLDAQRARQVE